MRSSAPCGLSLVPIAHGQERHAILRNTRRLATNAKYNARWVVVLRRSNVRICIFFDINRDLLCGLRFESHNLSNQPCWWLVVLSPGTRQPIVLWVRIIPGTPIRRMAVRMVSFTTGMAVTAFVSKNGTWDQSLAALAELVDVVNHCHDCHQWWRW